MNRIYVVFLITLLLIFLITLYYKRLLTIDAPDYNKYKRMNFYDYPFKTGDLVVTCTRRKSLKGCIMGYSFSKFFTNCAFHHAMTAYIEPNTKQLYFWEMTSNLSRLVTPFDILSGRVDHIVAVRPINKEVNVSIFENTIKKQYNYIYNSDVMVAWHNRYVFPNLLPVPLLKGYPWGKQATCIQMTTELYHMLGVLDFKNTGIDPSSIFPADYLKDKIDTNIIPLANGYNFDEIVILDYETENDHPIYVKENF